MSKKDCSIARKLTVTQIIKDPSLADLAQRYLNRFGGNTRLNLKLIRG